MQIAELFDELNEQELEALTALPVRGTADVSVRAIRRRVGRALDEDPAERRGHMKQVYKKGICAALIAACLLTVAFAAAAKFDLLRVWLKDDSFGALEINTEKQSIDNGDLRLTLEESLSDATTTYVAYSLTALTEAGEEMLEDPFGKVSTDPETPSEDLVEIRKGLTVNRDGSGGGHFVTTLEPSQPGRRAYCAYIYGNGPVSLTLYGAEGQLDVPPTANMQSAEIAFDFPTNIPLPNGTEATFYSLKLTSLGYSLDAKAWHADSRTQRFDLDYTLYFLMKDGSLHTMGELKMSNANNFSIWKQVLDLNTVEAVILNDTAYYLDGRAPAPYTLPDEYRCIRLEPRVLYTVPGTNNGAADEFPIYGYPARALVEPFGGTVEYDAAAKTAVLTHGDYTCTVTVGSPVVEFGDGETLTSPYPSVAEIVDGTLYLLPFGFDRTLGIYHCGTDCLEREESYPPTPTALYYVP